MEFTFDYDCFSDLYKDVNGFRPRSHRFYMPETTDEERQEIWDDMCEELDRVLEADKLREEQDVEAFKALIQKTIEMGAEDEEQALRWISSNGTFYNSQCVEGFVWEYGILFTPYGKAICEKLYSLVTYTAVA